MGTTVMATLVRHSKSPHLATIHHDSFYNSGKPVSPVVQAVTYKPDTRILGLIVQGGPASNPVTETLLVENIKCRTVGSHQP